MEVRDSYRRIQGELSQKGDFLQALKDKQDLDTWENMKRAYSAELMEKYITEIFKSE